MHVACTKQKVTDLSPPIIIFSYYVVDSNEYEYSGYNYESRITADCEGSTDCQSSCNTAYINDGECACESLRILLKEL